MAGNVAFYRGREEYYNAETHIDGVYFAPDTQTIWVNGVAYGGYTEDPLWNDVVDKYSFTLYANTDGAVNLGVNVAFQEGSTYVNIPFTYNDEEIYSGTAPTQVFSNDASSHTFNFLVDGNYGDQYTFAICSYTNTNTISYVNIDSTMPSVNMHNAFYNGVKIDDIDSCELNVTAVDQAFYNCSLLSGISGLNNWNTVSVSNYYRAFGNCRTLTHIPNWTVSANTTNIGYMFDNCVALTDIDEMSNWDTSNVTYFGALFHNCGNIADFTPVSHWNTSLATSFYGVFYNTQVTTDIVANWDASKVTTMAMMFQGASNLQNIDGIANWNTSSVTNMEEMFQSCYNITSIEPVANWDITNVENLIETFSSCTNITDITPINNWTSIGVDCHEMFYNCRNIAGDVEIRFDISDAEDMFENRSGSPLLTVYASTETNAYNAIYNAMGNATYNADWQVRLLELSNTYSFYINAYTGNRVNIVAQVGFQDGETLVNVPYTFNGTSAYSNNSITNYYSNNADDHIFEIKVDKEYGKEYTFCIDLTEGMGELRNVTLDSDMPAINMANFFADTADIDHIEDGGFLNVTNLCNTFEQSYIYNVNGLSHWNTSQCTCMENTFNRASRLNNIDGMANWDTGNVTTMCAMFFNVHTITNLAPMANWNTSSLTNMANMFYNCINLADISGMANWNTSSVTNMYYTFYNCHNQLNSISALANWNVNNLSCLTATFRNLTQLTSIEPLANWRPGNLTTVNATFNSCVNITNINPVSNWDTSNVTDFSGTFSNCYSVTSIEPIANWNTSKATYMANTFYNMQSINSINAVANWDVSNVTTFVYMFQNCRNVTNASAINNWTGASANCYQMFSNCVNLGGNIAIHFNITCASYMFNYRSSAPLVNIYASTTTNAYNAIYRAMGNTTHNDVWNATLYSL